MKPIKIGLIGLGNAGSHLARELHRKHLGLHAVFTRDEAKANSIGRRMRVFYTHDLKKFPKDLDLYILAVSDSAISEVGEQLSEVIGEANVVHISGAESSKVLAPFFKSYGVFYPLQTLTKSRKVKFKDIPICIEANNDRLKSMLLDLARGLSEKVFFVNDDERAWLHITAVMVNNFTNHLYSLAQKITNRQDLDFDLLRPLILETAAKVQKMNPEEAQTGPAARGDQKTIESHLKRLERYPDILEVYKVLTKSLNRGENH